MRRLASLLVVAGAIGSIAVLACSSDDNASPSETPDATPDAPVVPPPASDGGDANVVVTPCAPSDLPKPTKKFCDLPGPEATGIKVPPQFCVREFTTTPILEARVLRFAPNGDLFVTAPQVTTVGAARGGPGSIVVLPDDDGDGRADAVLAYAGNPPDGGAPDGSTVSCVTHESDPASLACVHGLAFAGDYVYYTRSDEVRRFPYTKGDRVAPTAAGELVATLGGTALPGIRWTHTLEKRPDGSLIVSRGRFDTNDCTADEMTYGAVFSLGVQNGATLPVTPELVANGFRNPMYLRCAPTSCGDCYASELTGDNWDGVGGHEKLALLAPPGSPPQNWGFPCCVSHDKPNTNNAGLVDCNTVPPELVSVPLHDTNFGLDFDRGIFPAPYTHGVFVALHGAFTTFGGSAVEWIPADPTSLRPSGDAGLFADGFAPDGRATDVAFSPDGRLFIADDTTGKIYWVAPK